MPLDTEQLAAVRAEIGDETPPDDGDLDEIYDRVGSVAGVALEVTSKRLADLLASPAQVSSGGDSIGTAANIAELSKQATRLRGDVLVERRAATGDLTELAMPAPFDVEPPVQRPAPVGPAFPPGWRR